MIAAVAWRLGIVLVLWWALSDGRVPDGAGLAVAVVTVVAATAAAVALRLPGGRRPRLRALPRFAGFFLRQSLSGGIDVARRALAPGAAVQPAIIEVDPRLPAGTPRAVYMEVVSVMPGTLVVEELATGGALRVHALAADMPVEQALEGVRREVGLLFGLDDAGGHHPRVEA